MDIDSTVLSTGVILAHIAYNLNHPDPTPLSQDMGPSIQEYSVHAHCTLACVHRSQYMLKNVQSVPR